VLCQQACKCLTGKRREKRTLAEIYLKESTAKSMYLANHDRDSIHAA
jgi:hypothetical protein